jgi:hypothetical protein
MGDCGRVRRQTAGSNFLGKIFVERLRFIFLSCVERIIKYFSFKTGSSFTLSLLPDIV